MKGKIKEAIVATRSTTPLLVSLRIEFSTSAIIAYFTGKLGEPEYHIILNAITNLRQYGI